MNVQLNFSEETMPIHSKQSVKRIVLLSLSLLAMGGSVILSSLILGNLCSQVITNLVYCYNTVIKQQSPMP